VLIAHALAPMSRLVVTWSALPSDDVRTHSLVHAR